MSKKICVITGVGPGTGFALAKKFSDEGYTVAMLARDEIRLKNYEKQLDSAIGYLCDVRDEEQVQLAASQIISSLGVPEIVFHNAVRGTFGNFLEIDPADLLENFQVNTMGFLYVARAFAPTMVEGGKGVIMASGNTSAFRGKPAFSAFAPSKAAQRILCESIARDLGPKGIHVAYLTIDAVIDLDWTRKMFSDEPDDFFIKPESIAQTAFYIASQEKSAWSFNVEVRPFGEQW